MTQVKKSDANAICKNCINSYKQYFDKTGFIRVCVANGGISVPAYGTCGKFKTTNKETDSQP